MESLKALDTYDTGLKIRHYLERSEQSANNDIPAELSLPARLCVDSLELFREILISLSEANCRKLPRSEYISLERSFSQFKLWSDGYGVSDGELDGVLDKSKQLRRDTLKLLRSIGMNLTERLLPQLFGKSSMTNSLGRLSIGLKAVLEGHNDDDDGASTSSGASIDSLEDNLQEMTKDLQTDMLCLMELGDLSRETVLDSIRETEKPAPHEARKVWEPHRGFCDKVEIRFPRATELLVLRLGKANYARYIRCQQERDTCEQTATTEVSGNPPSHFVPDGSTFHDSGLGSSLPSVASHPQALMSDGSVSLRSQALKDLLLLAPYGSNLRNSRFMPQSSLPYAETVMSYGSTSGRSVRVPSLPAEAKDGKAFTCLVCGKLMKISNNSAWKQHIYSDLRPWLCLDMLCPSGDTSFKNKNDWISHLALDHNFEPRWKSFQCPLCHAETGTGKVAVTRHLGAHLEEISLAALPIDVDSESDYQSGDEVGSDLDSPRPQDETSKTKDTVTTTPVQTDNMVSPPVPMITQDMEMTSNFKQGNKRKRKTKINEPSGTSSRKDPSGVIEHVLKLRNHVLGGDVSGSIYKKFVYIPLKERFGQDIRVLIIEPGATEDPISCRLVPSALNNVRAAAGTRYHPFIALSYFWGEGQPIHNITLTSWSKPNRRLEELTSEEKVAVHFHKGKSWESPTGQIKVRTNLYRALQRFRSEKTPVTIWIDALCIDQEDENERSSQVKKMHKLYVNAEKVCIWLGTGADDELKPKHCFQFLKTLLALRDLEGALRELSRDDLEQNIENIRRLMCNKWFGRRWVLQEVVLAGEAEVMYGDEKLPWSDFSDAILIFVKNFDMIQSILTERYAPSDAVAPTTAGNVEKYPANELIEFTSNFVRRGEFGEIQLRMLTLEELVSSLTAFDVSDPRDTIYALLSLAKDTYNHSVDQDENATYLAFDERLKPNYKHKNLIHVYTGFIDYCIEKSGSLDILLRHWAPCSDGTQFSEPKVPTIEAFNKKDSLPSWISRLRNSSDGAPKTRNQGRSHGDSFVGAWHRNGQSNYSAASNIPPEYKFGIEESSQQSGANIKYNGRLSVKGLHVGTVRHLAPRAARGVIFQKTWELAGFDEEHWVQHQEWGPSSRGVPEQFWRTLVGDRGPNNSTPPPWYARACRDCLSNLLPNGDLQPDLLIASESTSTITKDFLERVKNVIWQRRLGRVQLKGRPPEARYAFGLFPPETQNDDHVCIFFGCSVPVILHPTGDAENQYTMVGECFVYGIMDGEAIVDRSPNDGGAQWFELV